MTSQNPLCSEDSPPITIAEQAYHLLSPTDLMDPQQFEVNQLLR